MHSILWTAGIPVTFRCAYRMQTTTTTTAEAPHRAQVLRSTVHVPVPPPPVDLLMTAADCKLSVRHYDSIEMMKNKIKRPP